MGRRRIRPSGRRTRAMEERVLVLINAERKKRLIQPIVWSETLHKGASRHSRSMRRKGHLFHAHTLGWAECCYGGKAARLDSRHAMPEATVKAWMSSGGHRAILLSRTCIFGSVGITTVGGFFATYRCVGILNPLFLILIGIGDLFHLPWTLKRLTKRWWRRWV